MARKTKTGGKSQYLQESRTLNPRPEAIRDELFLKHEFFDARDSIQVKYEMLRRHRVDEKPVVEVARSFTTTRQSFYRTNDIFDAKGIPGLLPKPRGPKRAHKCTGEVLDFVESWKAFPQEGKSLVEAVNKRFGIIIHPRSIDRALARRKKKRKARRT